MSDVFKTLAAVDCSAHTEKKGNFTYLLDMGLVIGQITLSNSNI